MNHGGPLGLGYRKLRWVIVGWVTLSTVLNLLDRQGLYVLAPVLRAQFRMSEQQYSTVASAFLGAYTVMYTVGGTFVDWIGERAGMTVFILWWSVWTMATSLVRGVSSLRVVQFMVGLGEPGNYPAGLRAMTLWFPKSERGLPIAIFSSGSSLGSAIAAPVIAAITLTLGWHAAFLITGALGLLWVVIWLWIYRLPKNSVSAEDLKFLKGDAEPRGSTSFNLRRWAGLLKDRNVLALVLARFISDPVWYFYLIWTPEYLKTQRGFSLKEIGLYAWIPFVAGSIGGILGGSASDHLIRRGRAPASARKRMLYISAAFAPLGMLTSIASSAAAAIALIAAMALVVYCWFINTAAVIPDVLPENVVGSVLGLMGTAGSVGGMLFTLLVGFLLTHYSYGIVFVLAGSMHVVAALILFAFMREKPRLETA